MVTAKETARRLVELLKREKFTTAVIPRDLLMKMASDPGVPRVNLTDAFYKAVGDELYYLDWYAAPMPDDDTYVIERYTAIDGPLLSDRRLKSRERRGDWDETRSDDGGAARLR